jgi:hypothetical protein
MHISHINSNVHPVEIFLTDDLKTIIGTQFIAIFITYLRTKSHIPIHNIKYLDCPFYFPLLYITLTALRKTLITAHSVHVKYTNTASLDYYVTSNIYI